MNPPSSIRIVSAVYPRPWKPESGRFAANLAEDWAAAGVQVDVASWSTFSERLKTWRQSRVDVSIPGVTAQFTSTYGTPLGPRLPSALRRWLYRKDRALIVGAATRGERPQALYAQFAGAGVFARQAAEALRVPYFVDLGESWSLTDEDPDGVARNRYALANAAGVVCVSPRLQAEAIELGADPARVALMPNYPNWSRFRPLDKAECRQKLGLDADAFLVAYLGYFYERKGAPRLNKALHMMQHPAQAAFLGSGPMVPDFPGVVQAGAVTHDELPLWLNAADVLALPTLAEGCCNAITEALACALPIVSSDIEDIRWQVPDKGVTLVDPTDPAAIAAALDALAADPARLTQMRQELVAQRAQDAGKNRSLLILDWMRDSMAAEAG